jgi:ABC-type branched-subunit amino acid transport system substrate-binding protein
MHDHSGWLVPLVGVLALGLVVGACGDSTSAGRAPIRIGSLVPVTGLQLPNWEAALRASARDVNAHGGIRGRRVEIDNCDDQNDPNLAESCARQLVADGVVATAGNITGFSMVEAPILDEAGISQVGSVALNQEDLTLPTAFPLDGGGIGQIAGSVFGTRRRGLHSFFLATYDTPPGRLEVEFAKQIARAAGVEFAGQAYIPPAASDFTPYAQAAVQAHADVVWPGIAPFQTVQLLAAAQRIGARYLVAFPHGQLEPRDLATLGGAKGITENSIEFGALPPVTATDQFPALRTFKADMDAELAAGNPAAAPDQRTAGSVTAWLAVQVIARLAASLPTADAASVLHALRTSATVDTLGLTPPWAPGRTGPALFPRVTNPTGYFITQHNGVEVLAEPALFDPFQAMGM